MLYSRYLGPVGFFDFLAFLIIGLMSNSTFALLSELLEIDISSDMFATLD